MLAALIFAIAIAPSPSPSPSATPLKVITTVTSVGRSSDLIGAATAASEGSIGQEDIATRPLLRPGELLEQIPGLVVSQHSGEGKANQYYLRGFQLDHGTDLDSTVDGVPINLPTHAHGQGYSDINWLMPELVSYVEFKKGTYYADQGDFSTAGSYTVFFRNTIEPTTSIGVGDFGYDRFFTAASHSSGPGNLLYAIELYHDNGSFVKPDEYSKYNGVVRYSVIRPNTAFSTTLSAYSGNFDSTDQIPQRLVDAGDISRFGYVDPTDSGNTSRYALSSQWTREVKGGAVKVAAFAVDYRLDLFSNFTYDLYDATNYYNETANPITCNVAFNTCHANGTGGQRASNYASYCPAYTAPSSAAPGSLTPAAYDFQCGDQREQLDDRLFEGVNVTRTFDTPASETTLGAGFTNYNIPTVALFLTQARERLPDGTLSDDHVVERPSDLYVQSKIRLSRTWRIEPGVRADYYIYKDAAYDPNNSGRGSAGLISPKMNVAYELNPQNELYLDFGDSFHSNDVRGVTYLDDPQTHEPFDSTGTPVQRNALLNRSVGEELGYRFTNHKLVSTVSFWQLYQANELIFDGDHGTTSLGGPSRRKGVELANDYRPVKWLVIDADFADSSATFLSDPDNQGTFVPESLNAVGSFGITADEPHYAASLRLRYFGPRPLDTQGNAYSPPSTLLNAEYTAKFAHGNRLTVGLFNILNAQVDDVTYYYASWLPQDAANPAYRANPAIDPALGGAGINDYHAHPSEARTIRVTYTFGKRER